MTLPLSHLGNMVAVIYYSVGSHCPSKDRPCFMVLYVPPWCLASASPLISDTEEFQRDMLPSVHLLCAELSKGNVSCLIWEPPNSPRG